MGGIVARYYLQSLEGYKRVGSIITVSSPHHGSYLAYLYPGKGTKQLRPDNNFLDNLEKGEQVYQDISVFSYWTPFDLMIIPASSSVWKIANNKKYYCLFHLQMLFHKPLAEDICKIIV
jgi:triacylglycerol lipase